ncbi:PREDICTED: uncharacterized protein LOC105574773 isoform X8 [Cercocebus atys]|uniref:uncharacterized protein LOC105574773 isoform X8 n=1 Tax=Cercocebus atys TaxID=9531 RepID=UPI0005F494AE|nr:PREDICTED: uncharacterized protein LOC105574773 isoform X8 [Cercocebus atys]
MFLQNSDPAPPDPPNQSQIQAPTDLVSLVRASNPPGGLYVIYPAVMFMSSEKRRFQVSLFLLLNYKGLTWTSQMPFMVEEIRTSGTLDSTALGPLSGLPVSTGCRNHWGVGLKCRP